MAPPSVPGAEPSSGMFDAVVEVKVGIRPKIKTFTLHEGLLRHYSAYFEAALGGQFAEAQSRVMTLPEEEVETFERFVVWLYTGNQQFPTEPIVRFNAICKLWVLADERQIPLLANRMIDLFRDDIVKFWALPTRSIPYIYKNTTLESGLRRFVIWVSSHIGGDQSVDQHDRTTWPIEAAFDMLHAVWQLKINVTPVMGKEALATIDMCPYHQHEAGVTCPKNFK